MAFTKILESDTNDKGVVGLPDTPGLTTSAMQRKFDELVLDVVVPKFNDLSNELIAETSATSLGAQVPSGISASNNVQSILNGLAAKASVSTLDLQNEIRATSTALQAEIDKYNTSAGAGMIGAVKPSGMDTSPNVQAILNNLYTLATKIEKDLKDYKNLLKTTEGAKNIGAKVPAGISSLSNNVQDVLADVYNACKSIGNMMSDVYDRNQNGIVDDSEALGGIKASLYQLKTDSSLTTISKTLTLAINELDSKIRSIEQYAQGFSTAAYFYIDDTGHYCVRTFTNTDVMQFSIDNENRLCIHVD